MRLRYTILWIDDRKDAIVPIEEYVKDHLDGLGFELNTIYRPNGKNITSTIKKHNIDLIAMDYNLGSRKGDDLLTVIRKSDKYIEAILYSQDAVTLKDKGQGLDGIYRARRSDIKGVIRRVIDRTIKKSRDLHVIRGVIIAEAIDIENQVDEIIEKSFGEKEKHFRNQITEKNVIEFGKKLMLLNRLISEKVDFLKKKKPGSIAKIQELRNKIKKLDRDVLDTRNILAHSKVRYDDDGNSFLKGINKRTEKLDINGLATTAMRKKFLEHSKTLKEISKIL
ncbi:MAG: response regulator [Planctomycetes bacterium]|nr:response regulator [Planctomycetota bacterium]